MGVPGFHRYHRSLTTELSLPFISATTEEGKQQTHRAAHKQATLYMSRIRGGKEGKHQEEDGVHVRRADVGTP